MRQILVLVLVTSFIVLALAVEIGLARDFDRSTLVWIQSSLPRWLDLPFSLLSLLGSFEITTLFLVAVLFRWFRPPRSLLLLGFFFLLVLVEVVGKYLLSQPGPPQGLSRYAFALGFPTGEVYTPFSFPSGHAARSAFITVVLYEWIVSSKRCATPKAWLLTSLGVAELVVLVSRVDLGDHWSSDVIGGALLGFGFALAPFISLDRTGTQM